MSSGAWIELLGTGAVSAVAGAGISAVFGRRKIAAEVRQTDASTADVIAQTAVTLLEPMRQQINELTARVAALEAENHQLRDHIKKLEGE
ncbi:hypothetical protein HUN08_12660 [Gordonia sp. X0973]|uniref:hypothetical protein n=1 Tax=Gordonia sp. X0973 TaxID=2742602 RepID=UPI000F522E2F|nr:hypothetical protein [Gordonia sp. X0973]QKT07944.1 hypothetical protein HUN08_12660 [Gordonia sp. X0973]